MFLHLNLFLCCASLFLFISFINLGDSVLTPDIRFNENSEGGKSSVKGDGADIDAETVAAASSSECYF